MSLVRRKKYGEVGRFLLLTPHTQNGDCGSIGGGLFKNTR